MAKKQQQNTEGLSGDVKRSIVAIVLFLLAFVSVLGFFGSAAIVGAWLDTLFGHLFGRGKWLMPLVLVLAGVVLLKRKERGMFYATNIIGFLLAFASMLGLMHIFTDPAQMQHVAQQGRGGGYIGYGLALALQTFTGMIAGVAILIAMLLSSVLVSFNLSVLPIVRAIGQRMQATTDRARALGRRSRERDEDGDVYDEEGEDDDYDEGEWQDDVQEDDAEDYGDEDEGEDERHSDGEDVGANIKSMHFGDMHSHGDAPGSGDDDDAQEDGEGEDVAEDETVEDDEVIAPQHTTPRKKAAWKVPPVTLVESAGNDKAAAGDTQHAQKIIQETYANFGINLTPADVVVGPTVTQYAFRPSAGVKLSRVTALSSDLALALAAHPIRIEAPIPGKSLIGIEVPNTKVASVRMRDVVRSRAFPYRTPGLKMALGKDVSGQYVIADLAKMPHVLVAGATGAGKSVTVNAMIISLLYQNTPEDLRLILVDPKRVELSLYNGIPHLLSDVIVENGKVLNALKWAVGEMERRYALLQEAGVREMDGYNAKVAEGALDPTEHTKMPAIVIVIDEMADLMASHGKEVESVIVRIAQMARAVGIHLILSTQRPSVEVLTGLIKANVPTRIALRVATQVDSRTILDRPGAEALVGRGDMLYLSSESPQPKRIQSVYVTDEEVKNVVKFLRTQEWPDDADDGLSEEVASAQTSGTARTMDFAQEETIGSGESDDPLYAEAKALVIKTRKASTSYLQRRFRIGYSRAARLIDELEDNGVIAPADGAKPRAVLVGAEEESEEGVDEEQVPMV